MTYFLDVNVWIALAAELHTHHRVARHWFRNLADDKLVFCRVTQLGFLRLLTNRHVMQEEVMSPDEADGDPHSGRSRGKLMAPCDWTDESATRRSPMNFPKRGRRSPKARGLRPISGPMRTSARSPTPLDSP